MPKLKETAKISGAVGGMAAANFLILKFVRSGALPIPAAGITLAVAWPLAAMYIAKKNPMLGAAIGGASMGATLVAFATYFTGDFSLMGSNPKQIAELKQYNQSSEMAGLPENLFYMNTGK